MSTEENESLSLPEDLPPVEPPSAGFILQLFLIPGLIVAVIFGVWAAFGMMAKSGEDWTRLVKDVENTNPHIRWRGATGLAQVLTVDARMGARGQRLTKNPEIAHALADFQLRLLRKASPDEEELKLQAYIARTLQLLDVPAVVIPALLESVQPEQDREVRKNALGAIAVIFNRAAESHRPIESRDLVDTLIGISREPDPLMRQMAAFDLGLVGSDDAREQLKVLLSNPDVATKVNAAIGLARLHDLSCLPILKEILRGGGNRAEQSAGNDQFLQMSSLSNVIEAVKRLSALLNDEQRREFVSLLQAVAEQQSGRIRTDALSAQRTLEEAGDVKAAE